MAGLGLRAVSGIWVGMLGGVIGIHTSLSMAALTLLAVLIAIFSFALAPAQARVESGE